MHKQTIDGVLVPRELLSYWAECLESAGFKDRPAEMRALLDAPVEPFKTEGWEIDHSAGRPILVHNKCSVIEAEQAYGLLALIRSTANKMPLVCECPPGTDRTITQGGHFPACTACKRRLP